MGRHKGTPEKVKAVPLDTRKDIVTAKVNNPEMTAGDLAEMFGLSKDRCEAITRHYLPKIRQHSDLNSILKVNEVISSLADTRLVEKLGDNESNISVSELIQLRDSTFKQNQLLTGGATDRTELKYAGINVNIMEANGNN